MHTKSDIKKFISEQHFVPSKKMGQNFLFDINYQQRIINAAKVTKNDGTSVNLHVEEAKGEIRDESWYKNTLLTQFNIYEDLSNRGKILYTKDGGIIIEDISK